MHCPHCHNEVNNNEEIRQIINDELRHLSPDVANSMLDQLATRVGRRAMLSGAFRGYENEVLRDEY
jgi:hypothetical protein